MPCRSDYLDQNEREAELQRAARLLLFLLMKQGKKVPAEVQTTANQYYADQDFIPQLCSEIRGLTKKQLETIVYDAHNETSRDLANWWERHQEADRQRKAAEAEQERKEKLAQRGMNKLTPAEIKAMGLNRSSTPFAR